VTVPVIVTTPDVFTSTSEATTSAQTTTTQTTDTTVVIVTNPGFTSTATETATSTTGDNINNGDGDLPFGYTGMNPSTGMIPPTPFGTLPYGGNGVALLGAGIPVVRNLNASSIVGPLGYKYGPSSAWYGALLALPLILLSLIFGLCVAPTARVVTQTHAPVARSVVAAPAVVGVPAAAYAVPAVAAPVAVSSTILPGVSHPPVAYPNPGAASVGAPVTYGASTIAPMAAAPVFGSASPVLRDNTPLTRRVTTVYHDNN